MKAVGKLLIIAPGRGSVVTKSSTRVVLSETPDPPHRFEFLDTTSCLSCAPSARSLSGPLAQAGIWCPEGQRPWSTLAGFFTRTLRRSSRSSNVWLRFSKRCYASKLVDQQIHWLANRDRLGSPRIVVN